MNWIKKGLLLTHNRDMEWMSLSTMVPFADALGNGIFRVYFSGRDERGRSRVGYFELDLSGVPRVRYLHPEPVLDLGALGAFDDSGVVAYWLTDVGEKKHLYYGGWTLGRNAPYSFAIGLAVSEDGGRTFSRHSEAPIMGRNEKDPYLLGAPSILGEEGRWRMWYASGAGWTREEKEPSPEMHIRCARSSNGIQWEREGAVCVERDRVGGELAIVRPCVLHEGGRYRMWYSIRSEIYRIGYAESENGIVWARKDENAGIGVSAEGWDSEMVEYAHVFTHAGRLHMLYNGNGFGRTGIGLAIEA